MTRLPSGRDLPHFTLLLEDSTQANDTLQSDLIDCLDKQPHIHLSNKEVVNGHSWLSSTYGYSNCCDPSELHCDLPGDTRWKNPAQQSIATLMQRDCTLHTAGQIGTFAQELDLANPMHAQIRIHKMRAIQLGYY